MSLFFPFWIWITGTLTSFNTYADGTDPSDNG